MGNQPISPPPPIENNAEVSHDDPGLMADVVSRDPEPIPVLALTDVMRAQTNYITAQENYIHDRDLTVLIVEQEKFINALAAFLKMQGETVLADMQEQFLGVQISALRRMGIL